MNAESIAFLAGEKVEEMKSNQKLQILLETSKSLYVRQLFLDFAKNLFDYLGSILSYLVLAIPIFSGVYDNLTASELSALISQVYNNLVMNLVNHLLFISLFVL